ncbi:hypothetical protein EZS27_010621 [termite gut metagenome]|uniref:BACON domain-containing protein n=1 Tax=termite gut metagenome TaxID=433724 RepID=A0A5J4S8A8_9ZZZZ
MFNFLIKMSMKIKFKYVFLLLSLLAITACDEKDDPVAEIGIDHLALTFEAAAGTQTITVTGVTTIEVTTVSANPEVGPNDVPWYNTRIEGSVIKVSVEANLTSGNRTASFTISSGESTPVSFSITQDKPIFDVSPNDVVLSFGGEGGSRTIYVTNTAEVEFTVEIPAGDEWLTITSQNKDSLTLTAAPSNIPNRESSIRLILGESENVIELTIKQINNLIGTYKLECNDYFAGAYMDRTFEGVILRAHETKAGVYVLKGKLPANIYSIECTYQEGKLIINTGQFLGQFGAISLADTYLYAAYRDKGTLTASPTYYDYSLPPNADATKASYVAPLTIVDNIVTFTFADGNTWNEPVNGIAVKSTAGFGGILSYFLDIKLTWVSSDLIEPTPPGGGGGIITPLVSQ